MLLLINKIEIILKTTYTMGGFFLYTNLTI
jgi:hypothetical protein